MNGGKRGGARVVYYNWTAEDAVVLLTVYTKSRERIFRLRKLEG